jgi:hypothetical protein
MPITAAGSRHLCVQLWKRARPGTRSGPRSRSNPLAILALMAAFNPVMASSQTVPNYIIDMQPAGRQAGRDVDISYVKLLGFFTSKTMPNAVLGMSRGLYLYTSPSNKLSGPWAKSAIDPVGEFYEQAAALLKPGDAYPGIVVSRGPKMDGPYKLVLYSNPLNRGGNPSEPWPMEVINPDAGCHELRVGDVDGDGLLDVVCSATQAGRTLSFIAFQNPSGPWQIVNDPFSLRGAIARIGESIDLLSISGGPRINVVAANDAGVYWFKNPRLTGGNPRTDPWPGYRIGDANRGVAIATGVFNHPYESVVVASNEEVPASWTQGLVWYEPSPDPAQAWISHSVDSTYRLVHQINTGRINGRAYFIVGEQEQTCGTPLVPAMHPLLPCRVTMFQFDNGSFIPFSLSGQGTHNQSAIEYNGGVLVVGANHAIYKPPNRALQAWFIDQATLAMWSRNLPSIATAP